MTCPALVRTDVTARSGVLAAATPAGYGPSDLRSAYNLTAAAAADGDGETVAVVDPYDDPDAESDLAVYRAQYGLPACTTANGCFTKVNENGQASPLPPTDSTGGAEKEEALDLDAVSAICPNCRIVLLEAKDGVSSVGTAENTAVSMFGAKFITNGWGQDGQDPYYNDAHLGQDFNHPGVAITAAAGNLGAGQLWYPAASEFVTAVGGTDLVAAPGTARGWAETAWGDTGSGCADNGKPSWQSDAGCTRRTANDVAAVADPDPGVAFYDTYQSGGWGAGGGTGVAAAIVASVYALAGNPTPGTYPSSYPYRNAGALNNITGGSNGNCGTYLCDAGPGYSSPTGLGTPDGTAAFTLGKVTGDVVTVIGPGQQASTVGGSAVNYQMSAVDSASGQSLVYSAAGLPPGLSIDPVTGLISGTATVAGTFSVTVTATDGTGAKGSVTFPWYTRDAITFSVPTASVQVNVPASVQIRATDSAASEPLTFSVTGLPPGLWVNASTGLVAGTPARLGSYRGTVTVSDPTGASATATEVWSVHGLVTLANPGSRTSTAGDPVNLRLRATDSVPEALSYDVADLPPGLYAESDGVIAGWPTTPGTYNVSAHASDGLGGDATTEFTWTVDPTAGQGPTGQLTLGLGGKCLDDTGDGSAAGTKVQEWACNGGNAQKWTLVRDGTIRIHQECLSPSGDGSANNTPVVLAACDGSTAQLWLPESGAELYNLASGRCLDDTNRSTANGTQVQIWSCTGAANQKWTAPAGPLGSGVATKCLDDTGDSAANGNKIQTWDCNGGKAQNWTVEPDGTVRINGECLDVTGKGTAAGTPVQLWRCTGQPNQQWRPEDSPSLLGSLLVNPVSGRCLTDPGGSTANGTRQEIEDCPSYPNPSSLWLIR